MAAGRGQHGLRRVVLTAGAGSLQRRGPDQALRGRSDGTLSREPSSVLAQRRVFQKGVTGSTKLRPVAVLDQRFLRDRSGKDALISATEHDVAEAEPAARR